jgi:hypothetical protein
MPFVPRIGMVVLLPSSQMVAFDGTPVSRYVYSGEPHESMRANIIWMN